MPMFVVRFRLWSLAVMLACGQLPLSAALFLVDAPANTNDPPSPTSVSVGWSPSPSTNTAGYFLCYGLASGDCLNRLDVGNATSATVGGLQTNVTYFFTVIAYDLIGRESEPSNEVAYDPPADLPAVTGPTLNFELAEAPARGPTVRLSFDGSAGATYQLQATLDFRHWEVLASSNCVTDGLVLFEIVEEMDYSQRFYRLACSMPAGWPAVTAPTLHIEVAEAPAPGPTTRLSFEGSAGATYQLQATSDFRHWEVLASSNCVVDGLVLFEIVEATDYPQRFYRLTYSVPEGWPAITTPTLHLEATEAPPPGPMARLSFEGSAGATYQLQATSDFRQWEVLAKSNCVTDGLVLLEVIERTDYPQRFYRLIQE